VFVWVGWVVERVRCDDEEWSADDGLVYHRADLTPYKCKKRGLDYHPHRISSEINILEPNTTKGILDQLAPRVQPK